MNSERHLIEEQRRYAMMEELNLYSYEERQELQQRLVREVLDREVALWALNQFDE